MSKYFFSSLSKYYINKNNKKRKMKLVPKILIIYIKGQQKVILQKSTIQNNNDLN